MRISHKHRFVFLAIPRTGSTTLRNILDDYSDIKSIHSSEVTDEFPFYNHISALELKKIFDNKGWNWSEYRRFCVIRNPYDRIVSLYHHQLRHKAMKMAEKGVLFRAIEGVKDTLKPTRILTFRKYVMNINPQSRLPATLKTFVCDEYDNFLVEDILLYENLYEELPNYLSSLGITVAATDIPHLNASEHRNKYRNYYDEETKERVGNLYAYEISKFGYSF